MRQVLLRGLLQVLILSGYQVSMPIFEQPSPEKISIPSGKILRILKGPNEGLLIFPSGLVHVGLNPKLWSHLDTNSTFKWGLVKRNLSPERLELTLTFLEESGVFFAPKRYSIDSVSIDFLNKTAFESDFQETSFINIDTIDYFFPIESVLLFKKLKSRENIAK